jgi:hypothetical protein
MIHSYFTMITSFIILVISIFRRRKLRMIDYEYTTLSERIEDIAIKTNENNKALNMLISDMNERKGDDFEEVIDEIYLFADRKIEKYEGYMNLKSYLQSKYEMIKKFSLLIVEMEHITPDKLEEIKASVDSAQNTLRKTIAVKLLTPEFSEKTYKKGVFHIDRAFSELEIIVNRVTNNKTKDIRKVVINYITETLNYTVFVWNTQHSEPDGKGMIEKLKNGNYKGVSDDLFRYTDKEIYIKNGIRNETILAISQYNNVETQYITGLIDKAAYNVELATVANKLMKLIINIFNLY